jgi:hypothetical protein
LASALAARYLASRHTFEARLSQTAAHALKLCKVPQVAEGPSDWFDDDHLVPDDHGNCKQVVAGLGETCARPGSRGHRARAVEKKQRRGRGGRVRSAVLLPGDRDPAAEVKSRSHLFRRTGWCRLAALASWPRVGLARPQTTGKSRRLRAAAGLEGVGRGIYGG